MYCTIVVCRYDTTTRTVTNGDDRFELVSSDDRWSFGIASIWCVGGLLFRIRLRSITTQLYLPNDMDDHFVVCGTNTRHTSIVVVFSIRIRDRRMPYGLYNH